MTIRHFIFKPNGQTVSEVTTSSGTGYIPTSIPIDAIEMIQRRINRHIRGRLRELRQVARETRRRHHMRPVSRTQKRVLLKRTRLKVRFWERIPKR